MNCGYEIKWSYDPRSYERNFCNCVKKPEDFRTSTGFEPVTSRYRCDALTNWAMKPLTLGAGHLWVPIAFIYDPFHISFHRWFIPHGKIGTHKWPAPNVSDFIAQSVRASHLYREVTGSNPVEVLNFQASLRNCKNCVNCAIIASLDYNYIVIQ